MSEIEEVKAIIAQSGNTFHCKVLKFLREKDWTVLISPYYNDNVSNKPREIDLIAEKAFRVESFGGAIGNISVRLFIECKYISQKTIFWFDTKDRQKAEELVTTTTPLRRNNSYTDRYHYMAGDSVAKLFANKGSKSADNEIFYKALNQSLNAMVYYRYKNSLLPIERQRYTLHTVNYPVIVCNSFENLYQVEIEGDEDPSGIKNNFHLEVNYAYMDSSGNNKNEYFLIDILNFDIFDSFLEVIQKNTKLIGGFLEPE